MTINRIPRRLSTTNKAKRLRQTTIEIHRTLGLLTLGKSVLPGPLPLVSRYYSRAGVLAGTPIYPGSPLCVSLLEPEINIYSGMCSEWPTFD